MRSPFSSACLGMVLAGVVIVAPAARAQESDIAAARDLYAKAAYERKEWAAAASGFSQVLVTIADRDLVADAGRPPLSDIRTLASGFEELSAKAAAPPPPPPAPVVQAPPPPQPVVAATPPIYSAEDRTVVPPAPIAQTLPSF